MEMKDKHDRLDNIKALVGIDDVDVMTGICHWHDEIPAGDITAMINSTKGDYIAFLVMDVKTVLDNG